MANTPDSKTVSAKRYHLRQPDGGLIGPVQLQTVKDLLKVGQIGEDTEIAGENKRFRPIRDVAELKPFVVATHKNQRAATATGLLSETSFIRVLFQLATQRETGRLLVSADDIKKEIFLVAGIPVFVGSNDPQERIGEYLIARGAITRDQLNDALVIAHNFSNHLGNTLMTMNLISPNQFYDFLVAQLREKIEAVVVWREGRWDFYQGVVYDGPKVPVDLDPFRILLDGARKRWTDRSALDEWFGDRLRLGVSHSKNLPLPWSKLRLSPDETRLVETMNAGKSPGELALKNPSHDGGTSTLAICMALLEMGFLTMAKK